MFLKINKFTNRVNRTYLNTFILTEEIERRIN